MPHPVLAALLLLGLVQALAACTGRSTEGAARGPYLGAGGGVVLPR